MRKKVYSLLSMAFFLILFSGAGWAAADPEIEAVYKRVVKEIPGVSKELLAGAKKEGKLMIYHLVWKEAIHEMIKEFKKKIPFIEVDTFMASGGPMHLKFTSEVRSGRAVADLWQHTAPNETDKAAREGLLLNYVVASDGAFPADMKNKGWWYPPAPHLIGVAWNTKLVSDKEAQILKSWDGIVDPRWSGKCAMLDIIAGGTGHLPYYFFDKEKGADFWKKLQTQKPLIFSGIMPESERLAAGEFSVILHALELGPVTQWKKGAPVRWYFPEPALNIPVTQAISKIAPHPNAAKIWQEWTMTAEAQTLFSKHTGFAPARPGAPDVREVVKQAWYYSPKKFYQYKWEDIERELPRLKEKFKQSFR